MGGHVIRVIKGIQRITVQTIDLGEDVISGLLEAGFFELFV